MRLTIYYRGSGNGSGVVLWGLVTSRGKRPLVFQGSILPKEEEGIVSAETVTPSKHVRDGHARAEALIPQKNRPYGGGSLTTKL